MGVKFYEDLITKENSIVLDHIESDIENQSKQLTKQHNDFANHANMMINNLQMQMNQLIQQQSKRELF